MIERTFKSHPRSTPEKLIPRSRQRRARFLSVSISEILVDSSSELIPWYGVHRSETQTGHEHSSIEGLKYDPNLLDFEFSELRLYRFRLSLIHTRTDFFSSGSYYWPPSSSWCALHIVQVSRSSSSPCSEKIETFHCFPCFFPMLHDSKFPHAT